MSSLAGKTALITGASRGIGLAMARLFYAEGARLVLTATHAEKAEALAAGFGPEHLGIGLNLADPESVKNAGRLLDQNAIVPDILVNNAGIMKDAQLVFSKDELIDELIDINLRGTIWMTREVVKRMIRKRKGSIVNVVSVSGEQGSGGQSVYSATKAALTGLTLSLAKELAPLGIRVNAIAPGFIETDLISAYTDDLKGRIIENILLKRTGTPEEVAEAALFLASDKGSYITAQILGVDGGMKL